MGRMRWQVYWGTGSNLCPACISILGQRAALSLRGRFTELRSQKLCVKTCKSDYWFATRNVIAKGDGPLSLLDGIFSSYWQVLWMLIYAQKAHGVLIRWIASKVESMGMLIFRTGHWASGAESSDQVFSALDNTWKGNYHHSSFWTPSHLWLTVKCLGLWINHLKVMALV